MSTLVELDISTVNTMGTFWECGRNISRTQKSKKIKIV
jgi:hypothetical protein